ncbi:hypothetical protein NUSPORA_00834 [Nucleospora cyclopteri]
MNRLSLFSTAFLLGTNAMTPMGPAMDPVSSVSGEMQAQAYRDKMAAEMECKAAAAAKNASVDGISPQQQQQPTPQFDQNKYNQCVSQKYEHLKNLSSKIQKFVEKEFKNTKLPKKPCVMALNMKNKECYTRNAIREFLTGERFSMLVHGNVSQIWSDKDLVFQVVFERPEYVVSKLASVCKTFFKKPQFMATFNSTGDLVKSKGKIKTPSDKNGVPCKPCSDFAPSNTVEGKAEDCDNGCEMYSIFNLKNSIKVENSKASN